VANAPNASNDSLGFFVQDEWTAGARLRSPPAPGEGRYRAEATPGWNVEGLDFSDDKLPARPPQPSRSPSRSTRWPLRTAFRAPNIIERLFNGPTPEGDGYQILNSELQSEGSDNWDLGLKYHRPNAFMELVGFRSEIDDGIIQYFLSPAEVAALPTEVRAAITASRARFVVQQRNAERLRYQGIEFATGYRAPFGLTIGGNFSSIDGERVIRPTRRPATPTPASWWSSRATNRRPAATGSSIGCVTTARPTPTSILTSRFRPSASGCRPSPSTPAGGARLFERAGLAHERRWRSRT
jgi:outer membrane receptor protein involved in Fe transport